MSRVIRVNFLNFSNQDQEHFSKHTNENIQKIILENYLIYNYQARSGIADLLYEEYKKIKKESPLHYAALQNLFLEIYSKFIQISEDCALVGLLLLDQKSTIKIFMESNNSHIFNFYKKASQGFTNNEIIKI